MEIRLLWNKSVAYKQYSFFCFGTFGLKEGKKSSISYDDAHCIPSLTSMHDQSYWISCTLIRFYDALLNTLLVLLKTRAAIIWLVEDTFLVTNLIYQNGVSCTSFK